LMENQYIEKYTMFQRQAWVQIQMLQFQAQ
jgi:hypothetical protein